MSKPILIAQISDLHIKAPGELAYGKVDTAAALERCIATLNAFEPRPDLVVISGDLVDTPTLAEYEHLKRLLAPLQIPFIGIPGNHDSRAMMRCLSPMKLTLSTVPMSDASPCPTMRIVSGRIIATAAGASAPATANRPPGSTR